jgi:hypothetical protein
MAAAVRSYPILGRAQQASDRPAGDILDPYVVSQGGSLSNIRRALVTPSGESLYLVPGDSSICMMSSDNVVQGCGPLPSGSTQIVAVESTVCSPALPRNETEVAGILPPGASEVTARFSDGSVRGVDSANGAFAIVTARSSAYPESISWSGPTGSGEAATGLTASSAAAPCAG